MFFFLQILIMSTESHMAIVVFNSVKFQKFELDDLAQVIKIIAVFCDRNLHRLVRTNLLSNICHRFQHNEEGYDQCQSSDRLESN